MNPATFLRVLGPEPWNVCYAEPSIRPDDSRYGDNPNRLQRHTQFQVWKWRTHIGACGGMYHCLGGKTAIHERSIAATGNFAHVTLYLDHVTAFCIHVLAGDS